MSDSESTRVIKRLKKSLFKTPQGESVSSKDEAIAAGLLLYGVTVNIQPTRFMNKKQWKHYSHDQQRAQLGRIEASLRRKTPSIELIELHYEQCSDALNGQIHFHALYRMPPIFKHELIAYYTRVVGHSEPSNPWRFLDVKDIHDGPANWLTYIRKDAV